MIGKIYTLSDPRTGETRYCGKTVNSLAVRLAGHHADAKRGLNRHLTNWLRKLEDDGYWPPIMEVCETVNLSGLAKSKQNEILNEAEIRWIAFLKDSGASLVNATIGGDGSHGRPLPAEQRQKIAEANRGKKRSPQAKENMRQAQLNKDPSCILRGDRHPHFGKPAISKRPDVRAKLSAVWTEEKRAQQATHVKLTQTGVPKKLNTEQIINIYNETGSFTSIASKYGVSRETVSKIRNHKRFANITLRQT